MRGEELRRQLDELAHHFDRAVPSVGRYVREPARADETGVTYVPPPVSGGMACGGAAAALAAGFAVGWLTGRRGDA
jgi:hypothetical protein